MRHKSIYYFITATEVIFHLGFFYFFCPKDTDKLFKFDHVTHSIELELEVEIQVIDIHPSYQMCDMGRCLLALFCCCCCCLYV